ncbi:xanthine dehydrogenase small subunit [Gemmatimonas sp.]
MGAITFWLNGERYTAPASEARQRLTTWLRETRHLTGTKLVCGTGDCGSCTVLLAAPYEEPPRWRAVNSCLLFVHQLHAHEVRTVEGIGSPSSLHAAQRALVDGHGTQCGMCTPGLVMSMTAALQQPCPSDTRWWAQTLCGNVCRCTGYASVLDAAVSAALETPVTPPFSGAWLADRAQLSQAATTVARDIDEAAQAASVPNAAIVKPTTLAHALAHLAAHPSSMVAAGTTDLALEPSVGERSWLDLSLLKELAAHEIIRGPTDTPDVLVLGAMTTWRTLRAIAERECQPLATLLDRMGGPQIQERATVGGNIMTASSIGDLLPLLYAMDATAEMAHRDGVRQCRLRELIVGPRTVALREGELLTKVRLPLPRTHDRLVLEKVSRRRDMDIATVSLAVHWRHDSSGRVSHAAIAAGGVAPTVLRFPAAEARLVGSTGSGRDWHDAATLVTDAAMPRSDVRGSAEYRRRVLHGLVASLASNATEQPGGPA